jgi:alpha-galactosidase
MSNQKIVLIGAGSLQFGLSSVGNILESEGLLGSTLCLHDIDDDALNLTFQACNATIEHRKLDFDLEVSTNRREALKGATFIINSIEIPPRFELMDTDFRVPQYYGCKQILGENGGPGGLFHSLRVIPPILDICEDISKICPNAFLINFSNPMTRICLAIHRKFPSLKLVGLCHEYVHFTPIIRKILNTPLSNLEITAGGFNHFGVILDIKYKDTGIDAYPDIRKKGPEILRSIKTGPALDNGFDLIAFILETYNYLPYTPDSHYGEYLCWAWEKANIHAVRQFMVDYENHLRDKYLRAKRYIEKGKGWKVVKPDEETAVPIIDGIVNDRNLREPSVNIPNDGIITNVTQDAIIECPVVINKDGVQGIKLGDFPYGLAAFLRTQYSIQDLVVEAILQKSKDVALQALLADPVIESTWQAKKILDEMLNLQKDYIQIELE